MMPDPIAVTPLTTIDQAAQIMLQHRISCLPVMLGDKVIGIITEGDMLRILVTETAGWAARV
jgi:CBS domain-containing protein